MLSYSTQDCELRDKYHPQGLEKHKEGIIVGHGFRIQCIIVGKALWKEHEAMATLYLKLESRGMRGMLVLSSLSPFHSFQEGLWPVGWCQPQYQLNLPS